MFNKRPQTPKNFLKGIISHNVLSNGATNAV